ncbi:MAG: hypothetical protein IKE21_07160 [Erysipelotrichaceae bacterium]|nr:hypothetical protein [Erysipelotrichaceae bacterium]
MYYLIEETLKECTSISTRESHEQYVAVLTPEQWQKEYSVFDLGIDMDFETLDIHTTMAEVNYDSITGSFALPSVRNGDIVYRKFAFVIDEKGIVFIDEKDPVEEIINRIMLTRKWRMPGLERFIYDFLEECISSDLSLLEDYEKRLTETDKAISSKEEIDLKTSISSVTISAYYEHTMTI